MKKISVKKLALAGMLCALCVVGSVFSFPMFGSKCAPIQHMVNVTCAVLLGPWWGVGVAFVASLLRNLLGLGSLMAFPGSMFGALLCGLVYHKTKNILATMALAGITKPGLKKLNGEAICYMADPAVAEAAKQAGTTRAVAAMHRAAREHPGAILAIGNAPTALLTIAEEMEAGLRPALVIGVPVGFVNVVESKEVLFAACERYGVPAIAAMGRKGGSNVAAAICNALIYSAAEMLDPSARGWNG